MKKGSAFTVLKETCTILSLIGFILLIAPMSEWLFYWGFPVWNVNNLPLYLALPIAVLAYAIFDIKRLYENKKYAKLRYFSLSLVLTICISTILLLAIFPYFEPNVIL